LDLAREKGISIDIGGFRKEFERHRELSRVATDKKFKSGLADQSAASTKLHTATHLLQASLRRVLGPHIEQRGSNITPERLRFDFTHDSKLTSEQAEEVEKLINDVIERDLPIRREIMTVGEALRRGAIGVFARTYSDKEEVSVYFVGTQDDVFSGEICAGPHVSHTAELGRFRIAKQKKIGADIVRISAVLE